MQFYLRQSLSFYKISVTIENEDDNLNEIKEEFLIALKTCRVLLCDEFTMDVTYPLLRDQVRGDQHCVLFTSRVIENLESVVPEFQRVHLDSCLRSTCQLSEASNDWLRKGLENFYHTPPLNNFVGEKLDIRQCDDDFETECFQLIISYADKLADLDFLPVAACVGSETLNNLLEKLQRASYHCHLNHLPDPNHETNDPNSMRKTPIKFFDPPRFDGCEWSTVLVLLDFTYVDENIEQDLFIAVTRASMKVAIIFREIVNTEQIPKIWKETIKTKLKQCVTVCNKTQNENSKPATLLVGETPELFNVSKVPLDQTFAVPLPDVGVSLHKLSFADSDPFFVCHVDDVFLQSDLRKLSLYGIQFIVVSHASAFNSDEHFHFFKATIDCITAGINETFDVYDNVSSFQKARERSRNLLEFLQSNKTNAVSSIEQSRDEDLSVDDFVFSWEQWMAKGVELQRLGKTDSAEICYRYSIGNLEKRKNDLEGEISEFRLTELRRRLVTLDDHSTLSEPERPGTSQ